MGVQTLRPELAVEGLDEAVIGGFAGPREVQNDIVGIGPEIEIPGDELTAVVDPDRSGIAGVGTDAFQGLNDVLSAVGEAGIGRRTEPRMGVDNGQDAELIAMASWSWTKSIAQTSFGPTAWWRSSRSFAFTRLLGCLLRS